MKRIVREHAVFTLASATTKLVSAVWGRSVVVETLEQELVLGFDRTLSGAAAYELGIDCDHQRCPE
jgi:hypothetical protein